MENLTPGDLTPSDLTTALRQAGVLPEGEVRDVAVDSTRTTVLSRIARLRISYDHAAPAAPRLLILKSENPERSGAGWTGANREIEFYAEIAAILPGRFTPRCFGARRDAAAKTWHLLLEDLSETHFVPTGWPLPLQAPVCERIVAAHASRQAACWDHPVLARYAAATRWADRAATDAFLERLATQLAGFAERCGDILPPERRDLFARLIDAAPRLFARYRSGKHLTIVQGDAHVWNCFLPRDGGADLRFFDWDSWRIDVGASDLAYMMAMHWYPDRRRGLERALLDRYHASLVAAGVTGYDRQALADDYRFATLWLVTWPLSQEAYGIPSVYWWNNLERILLAVDDLDCRALL